MRCIPLSSGFKATSTSWHGCLWAGDDVNVRERFTSGFEEGDFEFMIWVVALNVEGRFCGIDASRLIYMGNQFFGGVGKE